VWSRREAGRKRGDDKHAHRRRWSDVKRARRRLTAGLPEYGVSELVVVAPAREWIGQCAVGPPLMTSLKSVNEPAAGDERVVT